MFIQENLPKIKDGAYITNLDEYKSIGTRWITLYENDDGGTSNDVTYFDSFGDEHILKKIFKIIDNKNIKTNIFRIISI